MNYFIFIINLNLRVLFYRQKLIKIIQKLFEINLKNNLNFISTVTLCSTGKQ